MSCADKLAVVKGGGPDWIPSAQIVEWAKIFLIGLAVCLCHPHGQAGDATIGTRCLCKKSAKPIFSVRICVTSKVSALANPSWIRGINSHLIMENTIQCYDPICSKIIRERRLEFFRYSFSLWYDREEVCNFPQLPILY